MNFLSAWSLAMLCVWLCESAQGLSEQRHNARKQEREEDGRRGTSVWVLPNLWDKGFTLPIESKRILRMGSSAHLPHYLDFYFFGSNKYRIGCQWKNTEFTSNFTCNPKWIKVDLCCWSKGQESKEKRNRLLVPVPYIMFVICMLGPVHHIMICPLYCLSE